MFHALAYQLVHAAAPTNGDLVAVADEAGFTRRGGTGGVDHYIFTERYNLLRAHIFGGTTITRARFNVPEWNALSRHQIWPIERTATIPDRPAGLDLRDRPTPLPLDEELAVEATATDAAGTIMALLTVAPPGWNRNLDMPREGMTVIVATATVTLPATTTPAWTASVPLTFTDGLRGGWYTVLGAHCLGANNFAFRFLFPRSPFQGVTRQLRPGALAQNAIGDTPDPINWGGLGNWGAFHSFEPPQVQVLTTSGGTAANTLFLWLAWHGNATPTPYR